MKRAWFIGWVVLSVALVFGAAALGIGLYQERSVRVSLEALADRLASELADLHSELSEARAEVRQSRASLEDALAEKDVLVSKLREREAVLDSMKDELSQLKLRFQKVDLGSVTVPTAAMRQMEVESVPAPVAYSDSAEGSVVAINEEFHFVIVNLGSKNGIREGQTLAVLQDGERAGNLRVDLVEDATCAAALLSDVNRPLKIGDMVRATT